MKKTWSATFILYLTASFTFSRKLVLALLLLSLFSAWGGKAEASQIRIDQNPKDVTVDVGGTAEFTFRATMLHDFRGSGWSWDVRWLIRTDRKSSTWFHAACTPSLKQIYDPWPGGGHISTGKNFSLRISNIPATMNGAQVLLELYPRGARLDYDVAYSIPATITVRGAKPAQQAQKPAQQAQKPAQKTAVPQAQKPTPLRIITHPQAKTVAQGRAASFTVAVHSTGSRTLQWQIKRKGESNFSPVPETGEFSGTERGQLRIDKTHAALNGAQFRCVATDAGKSVTSNAATLTVTKP